MTTLINSRLFEDLLYKNYSFLIDDYDFSISKKESYFYLADAQNTRLRIFVEHATLVTNLEPIGDEAKKLLKKNIPPHHIGITTICEYLDSSLHYKVEMIDAKEFIHNIPVELERRSNLLKKYCGNLLKGDFSEWPGLMEYISDPAKKALSGRS